MICISFLFADGTPFVTGSRICDGIGRMPNANTGAGHPSLQISDAREIAGLREHRRPS